MDAHRFEQIADRTLHHLLRALDELDDVEAELSQGVLTLQFDEGPAYVINSHRNAGQIWLAADRTAWHFSPADDSTTWNSDKPPHEELWATLELVLSRKTGHDVHLRRF